jgi:hypothetical protein
VAREKFIRSGRHYREKSHTYFLAVFREKRLSQSKRTKSAECTAAFQPEVVPAGSAALLRPIFKLLKTYELVVLGDREFHSVELASWLVERKVNFVFRQKKDTLIKIKRQPYQELAAFDLHPGMKRFLTGVKITKKRGFTGAAIVAYWKRSYRGKVEQEPWYLLTNFSTIEEALKAYRKRTGIEAMFKDCKSGGYNLEGSKASIERLTRLILLIAIAYSCSALKGFTIKLKGQEKYIGCLRKIGVGECVMLQTKAGMVLNFK